MCMVDFGLAKRLDENNGGLKTFCGTPPYFAPEVRRLGPVHVCLYVCIYPCVSLLVLLNIVLSLIELYCANYDV